MKDTLPNFGVEQNVEGLRWNSESFTGIEEQVFPWWASAKPRWRLLCIQYFTALGGTIVTLPFLVLLGKWEVEQDPKLIRKEASKPANICLAGSSLGETKNGRFHTEGTEIGS